MPRACTDQDCACAAGDTVVDFVSPSAFPPLHVAAAVGTRLNPAAITDGQGFCERLRMVGDPDVTTGAVAGHPYDSVLGVTCHPSMTSSGLRCVPDRGSVTQPERGVFRDAACTQPLTVLIGNLPLTTSMFGYESDTGAYYSRGVAGNGPFYVMAGSCVPSSQMPWWELGPRAESTFEPLVDVID
jgi:hypothetical protein